MSTAVSSTAEPQLALGRSLPPREDSETPQRHLLMARRTYGPLTRSSSHLVHPADVPPYHPGVGPTRPMLGLEGITMGYAPKCSSWELAVKLVRQLVGIGHHIGLGPARSRLGRADPDDCYATPPMWRTFAANTRTMALCRMFMSRTSFMLEHGSDT